LITLPSIQYMYPFTLLEGQGMGTAYEYYSKLKVMNGVLERTGLPTRFVAVGLPEKHGYDLDFVLLVHQLQARGASPLLVMSEDRPHVLDEFRAALGQIPDPVLRSSVELVQLDGLTDWRALEGRRFDWLLSTASVQRLPDAEIITYIRNARQIARYAFLFVPNGGNRAHMTLSGLRGLELAQVVDLCRRATQPGGSPSTEPKVLAAGYCDIPPFPPGLARSQAAKEKAMHSPLETLAMRILEWWCKAEFLIPRFLQRRLAHLVYVALDLGEAAA
jgi:hypothetical protein